MISIRAGQASDAPALAELIYSSAPSLLSFLFGSPAQALQFLRVCAAHHDGQYSASRHMVAEGLATDDSTNSKAPCQTLVGCMSLWSNDMPQCFHEQTLHCLAQHLDSKQLAHIINANEQLLSVFPPPTENELCLGHLAVSPSWQGMQVGTKLIAYAIRQTRMAQKARLVLDVEIQNQTALSFYDKCEFMRGDTKTLNASGQGFVRMYREV